jgi:hypothetical protein
VYILNKVVNHFMDKSALWISKLRAGNVEGKQLRL